MDRWRGSDAMAPEPAEYGRSPKFAISADRIFDGYRWHDNAVLLIDRGVVLGIAPRDFVQQPGQLK